MSQYNEGKKAFTASGAISRFARVKLSAGSGTTVEVAGSDEFAIGIADALVADGETVTVKLINAGGTLKAIAGEALDAGASLYGGASGKVVDTDPGAGTIRFVALEAAGADGDIIEVLPTSVS